MIEKIISKSVRLMFTGGLVLSAPFVSAQETTQVQKVEVTGSRIPSISIDGPSPVTQISAKDMKVDGVRNIEDVLNNLPQVFADQGGSIVNGATGTATVSLRGLGPNRTLVLVNGKRMPGGSTNSPAADLNQIPTGLIKRVDILTGGAGAVYGAGAVSGVVNFLLKDNFQGLELQANISGHNHKQQQDYITSVVKAKKYAAPDNVNFDGQTKDVSILFGSNFDNNKGNATLYFSYKETDELLQSQRDFSACSLSSLAAGGFACVGSGTPELGRIGLFGNAATFVADANGVTRPYTSDDAYNFGPINHLLRPTEQYLFNAKGHYDINDQVRVYEEFNFHSNNTNAQIAASGAFFARRATISFDNPLLSPQWRTTLGLSKPGDKVDIQFGKRNTEGGGRVQNYADTSFRNVLGVKGEISNWTYDVFGQFARVNRTGTNYNYFDNAKISKAMDVVVGANGQAVCRSAADGSDPACVPYNIYKQGAITKAQTDYLAVTALATGYTQQTVVGANVGTDLGNYGVKTPWSKTGVGVAFGVERRVESMNYQPDAATAAGTLAGSGGPSKALKGSFAVKEFFGEVKVPVFEKQAYAELLEVNASYRNSDYNTGNKTDTWGVGLDYAPMKSVRIRASHQVAVRAPTIFDLFTPSGVGLGGPAVDPCEGTSPKATQAQCANTGVSAAQYGKVLQNTANQHQASFGGNTKVKPEDAVTQTFGFVVEPMKNLVFTVDAFKIDIENTISAVDSNTVLQQCLTKGTPLFCNMIKRDSLGSLWVIEGEGYIEGKTTNIGKVSTSGVDLAASYNTKLGTMGNLNLMMNGTLLKKLEVENVVGLGSYNCVGYFGNSCGTSTPKWRHKVRATWATPYSLDASLTWRHIGDVDHETSSSNPLLKGTVNPIEKQISARNYFDVNFAYALTKNLGLSFGINNLLDKDPPVISTNATGTGGSSNGNTYPQVYESMGRKIYANVTAKF
ncbi:TonB-dependent receptor [Undibacterium seohonense]|uniref:TonB-dependent receptor n=1 Tax=Undibacterium seohonense TaxID=1344950 RepID=A0ABR6X4I5_9BURK|nr:TonB-dependent receptor [Undibacterium seohonense]MBC3807701.1 TonB-dependent receptor [Undibacterium seohonense]